MDIVAVVISIDDSVAVTGIVTVERLSTDSGFEGDETINDDGVLGISLKRVLRSSKKVVVLSDRASIDVNGQGQQ